MPSLKPLVFLRPRRRRCCSSWLKLWRKCIIVGELAALDPEPRSASVSAIDPTTLYGIEQATLQDLMAEHPEIVQAVIRELAQRLRDTTAPYGFG